MNNGVYNNFRILDSTTISYMLSDQLGYNVVWEAPWWIWKQGLIWWNVFPIKKNSWGHVGSWYGCLTYMSYDPIEKWGTIWFQNWRLSDNIFTRLGEINYPFTNYAHLYGVVGVEEQINKVPAEFLLSQNYPNPFNSSSVIKYSIPKSSQITLKIFNTLGEEIETLINEEKPVGTYEVNWNAADLPSGVYFYKITAGNYIATRKMLLLK